MQANLLKIVVSNIWRRFITYLKCMMGKKFSNKQVITISSINGGNEYKTRDIQSIIQSIFFRTISSSIIDVGTNFLYLNCYSWRFCTKSK